MDNYISNILPFLILPAEVTTANRDCDIPFLFICKAAVSESMLVLFTVAA